MRTKAVRVKRATMAGLQARLDEAEETLRAIRSGEVDAVFVTGKGNRQLFTLEGAGEAYRLLIESMNEGALTLSTDLVILYANRCFARMVKVPLQEVMGSSLRRFLPAKDHTMLRRLMRQAPAHGAKLQLLLNKADGSHLPVHISIRPVARNDSAVASVGMVVTDMTEARRTEEMLRSLTRRIMQVHESERGRVASELHDNITQLLCAVLARCQALVQGPESLDDLARYKADALTIREMLGQAASEVERISRFLQPGVLKQLGLVALLRDTCASFSRRSGVPVTLACPASITRLSYESALACYRILQESLDNVELHATAHRVAVSLRQQRGFVCLTIKDDGVGFDQRPSQPGGQVGFGLLGMRERAAHVGGNLTVVSRPGVGTEIRTRIPRTPAVPAPR
jgi:PAS domain S-box-containing protein